MKSSLELVRRPSYATRYRTVRERQPGETSPTRRTATIVRRVPDTAVVEGKSLENLLTPFPHSIFSPTIIFLLDRIEKTGHKHIFQVKFFRSFLFSLSLFFFSLSFVLIHLLFLFSV